MANRPYLLTKKTMKISAYIDSAVFHVGKGLANEKIGNTFNEVPYGVVNSKYTNPFQLSFDTTNKTVSINPGILQCYGVQVELTALTEVFDFHSTTISVQMFCTVYLTINFEDYTDQKCSLELDISGGAYKNFKTTMQQDNLYHLGHGIYQLPIARFTYTPAGGTFSDYLLLIPILENECRGTLVNLTDDTKLCGKKFSTIQSIEDGKVKFNQASNVAALATYNSFGRYGNSDPGYSIAKEGQAFGPKGHSTSIGSNLSGLYTVKRVKVFDFDSSIAQSNTTNIDKQFSKDVAHIKWLRLFFKDVKFKAKFKYETWVIPWGFGTSYKKTADIGSTEESIYMELLIKGSDLKADGSVPESQIIKFYGELDTYAGQYLHVTTTHYSEDGWFDPRSAPYAWAMSGCHRYLDIYPYVESGKLKIKMRSYDGSGTLTQWIVIPVDAWNYIYRTLTEVVASGSLYADIIYTGDADDAD